MVLCSILAVLPMLGPARVALAGVALVVGLTVNLALLRRVRRGHPVRAVLALSDMATVLFVVALAPAVYSAGVILIVSISGLFAFWFGGRFTPYLQVPVGICLLVIGLWRQPALWFPSWVAWLASATLGTVAIVRIASVSAQARTRYDDMVNGLDAMVWEAPGPTGDADYVSGRVTDLLGFEPHQVAKLSFLASHVHPEDLDEVIESRRRLAAGQDVEVHYRIRDAWARQRHLHERVRVDVDHDGHVRRRRGIVVDETARWEAESSARSYVDFIEGIPIALAILRLDDAEDPASLRVVVGNPASAALVGRPPEEVVDRRLADLLPSSEPMLDRLADVARLGIALERPSLALGEDGTVHALRAMPLPDHCIGIALEDVTKRARLAESLRHQALHDHLTGLPNRAHLNQRLAAALDRAGHDGSRTGLLLMDLNQFKDVNDSLGHEYGDRLLIELARRLLAGHAQLRHHRPARRRRVRDPAHRGPRRERGARHRGPTRRAVRGAVHRRRVPPPGRRQRRRGDRPRPRRRRPGPAAPRGLRDVPGEGGRRRDRGPLRRPRLRQRHEDRPARGAHRGGRIRRARRALPTPAVAHDDAARRRRGARALATPPAGPPAAGGVPGAGRGVGDHPDADPGGDRTSDPRRADPRCSSQGSASP